MSTDGLPQLLDAVAGLSDGRQHGRSPGSFRPVVEHVVEVGDRRLDAGAIGLVDHEDVTDFEQAGLGGLDAVTPAGVEDHEGGVGAFDDVDLGLPDANGFEDDVGESGRVEHDGRLGSGIRHSPELPPAGHRPGIDAGVGHAVLHPDAVTENGAAAEGTGWVDEQRRHFIPAGTDLADELVDEGALAGPGRTGDPDDVGIAGLRVHRCQEPAGFLTTALNNGEQLGKGAPVPVERSRQKLFKPGHGSKRLPDGPPTPRLRRAVLPPTAGTDTRSQ